MKVVESTPSSLSSLYFEWLCLQVDVPHEYTTVMGVLFDREFTWSIANDDNRASDGIDLRENFLEERGFPEDYCIFGPCSVLEMMVALAIRMENDIMRDPELGDRAPLWFWTMISNLRLDRYSDDTIDMVYMEEISRIIDVFIDREYAMNGDGGLFPLKKPAHNQRRVEVWYQMNAYLIENFD